MSIIKHFARSCVLLAAIASVMCLTSSYSNAPRYHYETGRGLGIYFTNADSVIEQLRSSLRRRSAKVTIEYSSGSDNMADIDALVGELMEYARSETDRPDEGDYLRYGMGGYEVNYSYHIVKGKYRYEIVIAPELYTDAEQEQRVTERVREIVTGLGLAEDADDVDKVCAVCGYIREHVSYDDVHKRNRYYHLKSTAYGALVNGRASCQGYAQAVYRLLRELGVGCRVITGMAYDETLGEEYHAWNIVEIDGRYYNIDLTWDDRLDGSDYFLKSEADFDSHRRDPQFTTEDFGSLYPMSENSFE